MHNLFQNIPGELAEEVSEALLKSEQVTVKRIISRGHQSGWYDQDDNEWVVVLKGAAKLEFENNEILHMEEGDFVTIEAHKKHRVAWTPDDRETIWLVVFYR